MVKIVILGLSAAAALGAPVVAQQQKQAPPAAPRPVTRAQVTEKIDTAFAASDSNHDGFLNATELQAMQNKGLQAMQAAARAKLQAEFNQLDTNKDGRLSPEEFAAIATVRANQTPADLIARLDTNKDGKLSPDEVKAPQLQAFDRLDTNHDGTVSVDEQKAAAAAQTRR